MILTHKRLLVDIFLTCRLSKSLAFCKFAVLILSPVIEGKTNCLTEGRETPLIHVIGRFEESRLGEMKIPLL